MRPTQIVQSGMPGGKTYVSSTTALAAFAARIASYGGGRILAGQGMGVGGRQRVWTIELGGNGVGVGATVSNFWSSIDRAWETKASAPAPICPNRPLRSRTGRGTTFGTTLGSSR
ncbi:hypothetical protein EHS25_003544 [Saitozyma podzolica]|uniref:Uncharacterized protein n=1 Tax=Saitozyma podzolica TaxID=1890683 RepID=A0A427Y7J4_9TREE|nr:hypothetical protein EHS25_003544 [Saitozyma podzolica]